MWNAHVLAASKGMSIRARTIGQWGKLWLIPDMKYLAGHKIRLYAHLTRNHSLEWALFCGLEWSADVSTAAILAE